MRVIFLAESMPDYAVEFANALAGHCEASLFAPARVLAPYRDGLAPELDAPELNWPRLRALRNAPFLHEILRAIRARRADIVHVLSQTLTWPALILPLRGPSLLVETVHDVVLHPGDEETRRVPPQFSWLLRAQADGLIVHGEALKKAALARFALPEPRIFVLPHLALNRYAALAGRLKPRAETDCFEVLFFGRVLRYKGLDHLIAAAESLSAHIPRLRVTIAGQGADLERCRAFIRTPALFDIRDRFIADEEAVALFMRADIVVLPYIEASQSGVAAMAAALGRAVIATDVGELSETVGGPAPMGLVVPPADPQALAAAILTLADSPALRNEFARAARARAHGPLGASATAAATLDIYHRLHSAAAPLSRHVA